MAPIFPRRNPTARRGNVNTQTTVGVNRLAIKPTVTIGNSIVKVFPKKVQAGKFPSLVPQNSLARSTGIALKLETNDRDSPLQQKWGYVQLGQSRKFGLKNYSNNNVKIDHSTAERGSRNLTDQTQTSHPKFFKLSDALVKCLMSKHNALLKDVRLQSANDRSAQMNSSMTNSSKLDVKAFNVSSSDTTNINSSFDFKKGRSNARRKYSKLKDKKNDVHGTIKTRPNKYQKKFDGKIVMKETNESNRNDTDPDNVKRKHRIKDITAKIAESTYDEQTISTENNSSGLQQESTTVTQQINDSVYGSNGGVTPALRRNESTISEVANGTIYVTTPKANILNIHGNETRNSGATNSNRSNRKTFKKNSSKSARKKHGSAPWKHDDYSSSVNATRTTTRFGIDAIGKIGVTVKDVNNYVETSNTEKRSTTEATRKKQASARTNDLTNTKKDYFLLMVKKHHKLLDYYNKYNSMKSKMPIPENIEKRKKDTLTMYNQTQRSVLLAHETFATEPTETTKIDKIDYSSIKIENLLYESNSPNVKLTRYFTKFNQTFNDIDKMVKNFSRSSHKAIQRSYYRDKEDCNPNKMHKRSNLVSRKLYNESSTTIRINNNIDSGLISSDEAIESTAARDNDNCTYSEETAESRETLKQGSKDDFEVLLNWSKPSSTTTSSPKIVTLSENGVKRNNRRGHNSRRRNDRKNRSKNRRRNHNDGKRKHTTVRWQSVETTSVDYGNDYSPESRNFSPNDPRYDKAGYNQDGSTGRSDWFTTDESTTEYFKVKSSDVDESVTEHLASTSDLQSEGTTNLIADGITSPSPTASDRRSLRKFETWKTTITESNRFRDDEKISDEKLIDCKDLVWFTITSSPAGREETEETGYASVSLSDDSTFTRDNEVSTVSFREAASKQTDETNGKRSTTYSTIKSRESNERGMTDRLISSERSKDDSEEAYYSSWDWKTVTHSVTGGTTRDAVWDGEEEENGEERTSSGEDGENDVQSATEDYEGEHCGKDQHACDKYTCIEEDKVCDGTADCPNANDEIDCEYIFRREDVNGGFGELDHSSRDFEVTSSDECSFYEYPCDGGCINLLSVCDGETDCLDGTDEENCTNSEGIFCAGSNIFWSRSAPRSCCTKFLAWN